MKIYGEETSWQGVLQFAFYIFLWVFFIGGTLLSWIHFINWLLGRGCHS